MNRQEVSIYLMHLGFSHNYPESYGMYQHENFDGQAHINIGTGHYAHKDILVLINNKKFIKYTYSIAELEPHKLALEIGLFMRASYTNVPKEATTADLLEALDKLEIKLQNK